RLLVPADDAVHVPSRMETERRPPARVRPGAAAGATARPLADRAGGPQLLLRARLASPPGLGGGDGERAERLADRGVAGQGPAARRLAQRARAQPEGHGPGDRARRRPSGLRPGADAGPQRPPLRPAGLAPGLRGDDAPRARDGPA